MNSSYTKIIFNFRKGHPLRVKSFCGVRWVANFAGLHVLGEGEEKSIVSHLIFSIIKAYVSISSKNIC